jgi:hypothetical protein
LKLLPGNIHYLALEGFYWGTPEAEAALGTAMRFLKDGDAVILDLRRNGGGWPPAVAALAGYFLPQGTPLTRFEMRGAPGEASRTPAAPFSLAGKPLFVLTSGDTASAAEEFASHVSAFGFGTLVGAKTAGAAYRNEFAALPGGFYISVSVGRPVHAKTGRDWEATGVAPALITEPEGALVRAQAEAMAAVAARAPASERATAERLLVYYRALAQPLQPGRAARVYAGRYGDRRVEVDGAGLTLRQGGRSPSRLVALGPDRFAVEGDPALQLRFIVKDEAAIAVELDRGEREPSRVPRNE